MNASRLSAFSRRLLPVMADLKDLQCRANDIAYRVGVLRTEMISDADLLLLNSPTSSCSAINSSSVIDVDVDDDQPITAGPPQRSSTTVLGTYHNK